MRFLSGLFRILLAVIAVAFAYNNWTMVPVKLWSGLIADVNLPLLLLLSFLIGFVPMLLLYHASRWRLRQRLAVAERALADLPVPAPAYAPPPAIRLPEIDPAGPPPLPPVDPSIAP